MENNMLPGFDTQNDSKSALDSFDCCSKYRECSELRRCVYEDNPCEHDPDKQKKCRYNEKLTAGIVYYGKNAPGYSSEEYERISSKYQRLADDQKSALKEIYYQLVICCCSRLMLKKDHAPETLHEMKFIEYREPTSNEQREILNSVLYKTLKADAHSKLRKKEELIDHIMANCPEVVEKYCGGIVFARLIPEMWRYAVELYYDYMG